MRFGAFVPQGWRMDLEGVPVEDQWDTMVGVAGRLERAGYESDRFRVVLMDWARGATRVLTESWDRSPGSIVWSADGKTLYANPAQSEVAGSDIGAAESLETWLAAQCPEGTDAAAAELVDQVGDAELRHRSPPR